MARRTVTVKSYRYNPSKLLQTLEDIVEYNTELGASSPFASGDIVDMTAFAAKVAAARAKRTEALHHYAQAEAAMNESQSLLGTAAGQGILTTDTCINYMSRIKRTLLVVNDDNPEELSLWGFDVTVGVAKRRKKSKKTAAKTK